MKNYCTLAYFTVLVLGWGAETSRAQVLLHAEDDWFYKAFFGGRVSSLGDINGDGISDYIANRPNYFGSIYGGAQVYSGINDALLYDLQPWATSGSFGTAVAAAGDFNNNGTPDILVGEPYQSQVNYQAGRVLRYGSKVAAAIEIGFGWAGELQIPFLESAMNPVVGQLHTTVIHNSSSEGALAILYVGLQLGSVMRPARGSSVRAAFAAKPRNR